MSLCHLALSGGDKSHLQCMPWIAGQIPKSKLVMVEGASALDALAGGFRVKSKVSREEME